MSRVTYDIFSRIGMRDGKYEVTATDGTRTLTSLHDTEPEAETARAGMAESLKPKRHRLDIAFEAEPRPSVQERRWRGIQGRW